MRSLLHVSDLTKDEIRLLIETAEDIAENPEKYSEKCHGKILATLFYEPSTRTRLSFTSAMMGLGGNVLGFSSASTSSATKGESVADSARTVGCYADIIAMRHPEEGAPMAAAISAGIPVINAGDGGHQHPTQTLTDLLTVHRRMGRLSNLTVGVCGDLKYGRTVHSLLLALTNYPGIRAVLISPPELSLPGYVKRQLERKGGLTYTETESLEAALPQVDVLYMTRIQKERFEDKEEYERLKGSYILDREKMTLAKKDMAILHPLPRVDEISPLVDDDPRAAYFEQVKNGKFMRMALILFLLGLLPQKTEDVPLFKGETIPHIHCKNPRCISKDARLIKRFYKTDDGKIHCLFCDAEAKED